jgi:hypothetical protein
MRVNRRRGSVRQEGGQPGPETAANIQPPEAGREARAGSSWEKFTRRYVWDEQKTPFFVAVRNLNQGQARSEIFLFALFLATPFAFFLLGAVSHVMRTGAYAYLPVAMYAASVLAATGALCAWRSLPAALYCATAPLAVMLYFIVTGHGATLATVNHVAVLIALAACAGYTVRIVAIARAYAGMPEPPDLPPRRFR